MDFVTQGPEADTLICSASTIENLYPGSTFYIYDGGITKETRNKLSSFSNTKLINWRTQAQFTAPLHIRIPAFAETLLTNNVYITHIGRQLLDYSFPYKAIRRDHFVRQKPRVIHDIAQRIDGPLVWLDHDAVVLERFDEVYDHNFDIGATARPRYKERDTNYSPINTGVLIFNCDSDDIIEFTNKWMATIDGMDLANAREQEAVSKLFLKSNSKIFENYYTAGSIQLDSTTLRTKTFPCRNYNYYNFDESGLHPKENKIIHFKAGKEETSTNQDLIRDISENDISDWHRWET